MPEQVLILSSVLSLVETRERERERERATVGSKTLIWVWGHSAVSILIFVLIVMDGREKDQIHGSRILWMVSFH